jgi:hypothetical protein
VSAVGPLVAGVVLGAGLGGLFVGIHVAISLVALAGAWRLRAATTRRAAEPVSRHTTEAAALAA